MHFLVLSTPSQTVSMPSHFSLHFCLTIPQSARPLFFLIPSCPSSLLTPHPSPSAFNNSSVFSLGVQYVRQESFQRHRQQAWELEPSLMVKCVLLSVCVFVERVFCMFKDEEMDCRALDACMHLKSCNPYSWILFHCFIYICMHGERCEYQS